MSPFAAGCNQHMLDKRHDTDRWRAFRAFMAAALTTAFPAADWKPSPQRRLPPPAATA